MEPGKRQVMDGQVGFSLSWRWLAILSGFQLVQQGGEIAGVGSLLASCGFSAGRRPSFWRALESSSPCSQQPDPNLLRLAHTAKLPALRQTLSSCIVIHQLSLCLLLRNTSQHLFQPCHPCYQSSASFSASFEGVTWSLKSPSSSLSHSNTRSATPSLFSAAALLLRPFPATSCDPTAFSNRVLNLISPPEAGSFPSN